MGIVLGCGGKEEKIAEENVVVVEKDEIEPIEAKR